MSRRTRKRRGDASGFNLSFLDAISCGFGAIVMLLVLTKIGEPRALERARLDLDDRVAELRREIEEMESETRRLSRQLVARQRQLSREEELINRVRGDLIRIEGDFSASQQLAEVQTILEGELMAAQQSLTDEMRRLLESYRRPEDDSTIGGIPVDSEYIIFVIDTSGSMFTNAWPAVVKKMEEVLDIYPKVKGLQIMNDMGEYMFDSYARKWIPDTPGRRKLIVSTLRNWNAFSNSSPVEGVQRAIVNFASDEKKVSVYVFGDEFTGSSIEEVLEGVAKYNTLDANGNPRVRIHAVGFPVIFSVSGVSEMTGIRFAMLMRVLCHKNAGTFVGLNTIDP